MATKNSRSGGKFTGNHSTLIPAAVIVADIANECTAVTKISPGFIKSGLKSAGGKRRLKITNKGSGLLLSVRDNTSHQELHVYGDDLEKAADEIARRARSKNLLVSHP